MTLDQEEAARRRAEKRVKDLRGFYGHLFVYLAVMVILIVVDLADGDHGGTTILGLNWAYWPIVGWGVFVLINAVTVLGFGTGWERRKIEEYLEEERERQHI